MQTKFPISTLVFTSSPEPDVAKRAQCAASVLERWPNNTVRCVHMSQTSPAAEVAEVCRHLSRIPYGDAVILVRADNTVFVHTDFALWKSVFMKLNTHIWCTGSGTGMGSAAGSPPLWGICTAGAAGQMMQDLAACRAPASMDAALGSLWASGKLMTDDTAAHMWKHIPRPKSVSARLFSEPSTYVILVLLLIIVALFIALLVTRQGVATSGVSTQRSRRRPEPSMYSVFPPPPVMPIHYNPVPYYVPGTQSMSAGSTEPGLGTMGFGGVGAHNPNILARASQMKV